MKTLEKTLTKLAEGASYFETSDEQDGYLEEVIASIMAEAEADMVAVFLHEDETNDLVFRAGIDSSGIWDQEELHKRKEPPRISPVNNELGDAFVKNRVVRVSYGAEDRDHPFKSKLIIPIAKGPLQIGIVIIAFVEPFAHDNLDENNLLSLASELGETIEDASVFIEHPEHLRISDDSDLVIKGRKASDGMVEGLSLPFWDDLESIAKKIPRSKSKKAELQRFDRALKESIDQLEALQGSQMLQVSEMGSMIFMAHSLMLKDDGFTGRMRKKIEGGDSAVKAILTLVDSYAARFAAISEVRIAEKAQDVRDLGYRLIRNLDASLANDFSYDGRIALARHIYPSDLLRLSVQGISGIVLLGAGVTAHISILAKSLNVPVLITDDKALLKIKEGTPVFLNATKAELLINPSKERLRAIQDVARLEAQMPLKYTLRGHTADNQSVQVMANVNILKDAEEARRQGAEGIGLYRSEFPFILKNDFLTEEQQYQIYRSIARYQPDKPVIFRTADIGGDKIMQGRGKAEENPFLGVRGIRFSLANREMFGDQLRAMLRAGHGVDLGIMLPMVSSVEEVLEAKEEIAEAIRQLQARGAEHNSSPKIGAMVELPSAALAVDELAAETDFLSIGTNDLTMYLLAVDRTNENLSHLYRSHHPSVLGILRDIASGSARYPTDISVCGDVAQDPYLIPFFVGIGIRKLSVPPASVEKVKRRLKSFTLEKARAIADEMLAIKRIADMETYLSQFDERHNLVSHSDGESRLFGRLAGSISPAD